MRTIIIALLLSTSCNVFAQSFDDGLKAYIRGNYYEAFNNWLPFAEKGNAEAQYFLGYMYHYGEIPENDAEAVRWYRLAAEQGHVYAQYNLADMYDYGQGVPENDIEAYMWFSVSAAQGNELARSNRDTMRDKLTPSQLTQAQELATRCFESDFQDCE
jgi:hypothetical protein